MGYVRTGDNNRQNNEPETLYRAPDEIISDTRGAAQAAFEQRAQQTTERVFTGGTSLEVIGGAAAVVLAIIGISSYMPLAMCAIATIAIGCALLSHGGSIAARWNHALARIERDRGERAELASGVGTEVFAGAAGIVLGVLALAHVLPHVMLPVAAILFGGSLLLGGSASAELEKLAPERGTGRAARVTHQAIQASGGVMVLVGIAAAVLGILGLIHVGPYLTLSLIAMLCVGAALVFSGSSLAARFVHRMA
ncbi:MAG TPA: hypothetical protein VMJ10_09860 [Kofleriaceae bacterium]|nr:hypothetical protein [Kofleriaceae bacterium]